MGVHRREWGSGGGRDVLMIPWLFSWWSLVGL